MAITHYLKFEKKLKYFEGYLSSVECISKDDGAFYVKTSIPLKQKKDDEPLWLNVRIFDAAMAYEFSEKCKKGSFVGFLGILAEVEDAEGKEYTNFYPKMFQLLREPVAKE